MAQAALASVYQRRLARLAAGAALLVGFQWDSVEGLDDETADRFASLAGPVALAAQRQAAYLTDAYLAAYLTRELGVLIPPRGVDPEEFTGAAVRGVAPDDVWRRSVVTARAAITRGRDYVDARAEGRARAAMTARTEVALSARAVTAAVTGSVEQVTGYRRVLGGQPCKLCASAAAKTYRKGDLMPLHASCSCGVAPVFGPVETTESDEVKVVQHEELGSMLWQPEHDFAELH